MDNTQDDSKNKTAYLRFGIPSLDALIGPTTAPEGETPPEGARVKDTSCFGIEIIRRGHDASKADDDATLTVCIAGAAGVGKSILALHLASRYAADTYTEHASAPIHVFYASTDLSYAQALRQWKGFGLNEAGGPSDEFLSDLGVKRGIEREPFWGYDDPMQEPAQYADMRKDKIRVELPLRKPDEIAEIDFNSRSKEPLVHFLDLQANTAGDDWQFVNNLLGQLPLDRGQGKHLLIIDAVEGLEALTGTQDAYGQYRSRRSRITQIIRNASQKCHLLFIIEGGLETDLPEQFAADAVLRLRNDASREDYLRRTIEIEKVRGQSHIRGQHLLHFRRGSTGSSTGGQINHDDPSWPNSYVYVVPSLDLIERTVMRTPGKQLPDARKDKVADFGIRYLDDMLRRPQVSKKSSSTSGTEGEEGRGLPCGSVTAITGDDGTQKSRLVRAFLSRNFVDIVRHTNLTTYLTTLRIETRLSKKAYEDILEGAKKVIDNIFEDNLYLAHSLYFTTHDIDVDALARQTAVLLTRGGDLWRENFSPARKDFRTETFLGRLRDHLITRLKDRIIVRRMERHSLTPAQFFHIVRSAVRHAELEIALKLGPGSDQERLKKYAEPDARKLQVGGFIRVAIEDWQIIRDNYPEIRGNDRLLGILLFYLAREGVTTLLSQTAPGQPEALPDQDENRLQKEAHYNIRTWRIRFGDIDRVAITAIPPIATDRPSQIRELTWESDSIDASLTVDPVLELYQGLREGNPQLTPLRVRLNPESPQMVHFASRLEQLLRDKYPTANSADIKVLCSGLAGDGVVQSYEALRDLCHLRGDFPLDHSLVLMVDEFWSIAEAGSPSSLGSMSEYLSEPTWRNKEQERFADPDGIFQPNRLDHTEKPNDVFSRLDFFKSSNLEGASDNADLPPTQARKLRREFNTKTEKQNVADVDRVPFLENFGFLLCQERAWETASELELTNEKDGVRRKVGDVWSALKRTSAFPESDKPESKKEEEVSAEEKEGKEKKDTKRTKEEFLEGHISWRTFMEACVRVSQHWGTREYPVAAFDMSRHSAESLPCLLLEIWSSEIYADLLRDDPAKADKFTLNLSNRRWRQQEGGHSAGTESLIEWITGNVWIDAKELLINPETKPKEVSSNATNLYERLRSGRNLPGYTHALYRSLLIMAEVLTWDSLTKQEVSKETQEPPMHRNRAVASRVWYTTAPPLQGVLEEFRLPEHVLLPEFSEKDPLVMIELPGAFSTRGDWYLSVSPESRSQRLAERAVDLMSSYTSNLKRLEAGVGLPTRDVERFHTSRTPLVTYKWDEYKKRRYPVQALYRDVIALNPNADDTGFHSLWRSSIYDYDRQARVLQRWITRELQFLIRLRQRREAHWRSGFQIYDQLMAPYSLGGKKNVPFGLTDEKEAFLVVRDHEKGDDEKDKNVEFIELDSWVRFSERCTALVSALMGASHWQNDRG